MIKNYSDENDFGNEKYEISQYSTPYLEEELKQKNKHKTIKRVIEYLIMGSLSFSVGYYLSHCNRLEKYNPKEKIKKEQNYNLESKLKK